MDNKIYKTVPCRHYNSPRGCDKGDNCGFAHGEKDLRKKRCDSYDKCWDEDCYLNFSHPPKWNAYDNKEECLICSKGYCNKLNKRFKHIIDNYNFDTVKDDKKNKMDIPKDVINSDLIDKKKYINKEYLKEVEENIKSKLNINDEEKKDNENINDEIKSKKEILEKLENEIKDWSLTDEEYKKLEDEIKYLKENIVFLEVNFKNIDNLENNSVYNIFEDNIPDIKLTINGIEIDLEEKCTVNVYEDDNDKKNNIKVLIKNMEDDFNKYKEEIKKGINDIIKNEYSKYILMNNLNNISSNIDLFKNNYDDITTY